MFPKGGLFVCFAVVVGDGGGGFVFYLSLVKCPRKKTMPICILNDSNRKAIHAQIYG